MRRNNPSLGSLGIALGLLLPTLAHATQFTRWENRRELAGTWRLIPELHLLSTSSNYDGTGAESAPAGLSYSRRLFDFNLLYGLGPRTTAFARLSFVGVSFTTATLTGSGFGLGDQALGLNQRFYEGQGPGRHLTIDGQLQADFPLYDKAGSRRKDPPDPLLGEGTFDLTAGPFVTVPLNQGPGARLFLVGGMGVMIRNSGFSTAVPYQLSFATSPDRSGFAGKFGIQGLRSLSGDSGANVAADEGANVKDSGGSLIVDALHPTYMAVRAQGGWQFNPSNQLFLAYQKTLSGSSTAVLSEIALGAQFRFGGASGGSAQSAVHAADGKKAPAKRSYDLDANVTQTNDRLHLVRLDRGSQDGVTKGQIFDVFDSSPLGETLIARGIVTGVRSNDCVIQIRQYAKQVVIQSGFTAKRLVR